MSPDLEQALTLIQLNDYLSFIVVTIVGYDYILTFSKEIEYIWSKPWTRMSTLFVLARYSGMCSVILHAAWWNSAVNASVKGQGNLTFIIGAWCFWIFVCSADLMMILRLWALYARSKFVLVTLLALYAIEVITCFVYYIIMDALYPQAMSITRTLGYATCSGGADFPVWDYLQAITQLALGAWMFALIVLQFIKESTQMCNATNRIRLGRYQKLIVWEGMVYFIAVLGFGLNYMLANEGLIPLDGQWVLTNAIQQTLPFTLFPRFALSLRKLHMRDLERRWQDLTWTQQLASPEPAFLPCTR